MSNYTKIYKYYSTGETLHTISFDGKYESCEVIISGPRRVIVKYKNGQEESIDRYSWRLQDNFKNKTDTKVSQLQNLIKILSDELKSAMQDKELQKYEKDLREYIQTNVLHKICSDNLQYLKYSDDTLEYLKILLNCFVSYNKSYDKDDKFICETMCYYLCKNDFFDYFKEYNRIDKITEENAKIISQACEDFIYASDADNIKKLTKELKLLYDVHQANLKYQKEQQEKNQYMTSCAYNYDYKPIDYSYNNNSSSISSYSSTPYSYDNSSYQMQQSLYKPVMIEGITYYGGSVYSSYSDACNKYLGNN